MTTALLVIDVQESFRARSDDWAGVSAPDIAERIQTLVQYARLQGHLVVWILHAEPNTGNAFDPELDQVRLIAPLVPGASEPVVYKTSHNAFTTTRLAQYLTAQGVDHVLVAGIRTEQCCETTARVASDLGYRVSFVLDATATMPLPTWDGREILSAAQLMDRTASVLSGRFAEVVTIDEILARVGAVVQ